MMENTTGTIAIPLSKSKMVFFLFAALAFVAAGCWFVFDPPEIRNSFWGHPLKLAIVGGAAILFFGACTFYLIRKLRDNQPGMIIDDTGLTDNSGAVSAGRIPWSDIENISVLEISGQKMIMLQVANPEQYIGRQKNAFRRKLMAMNHRMYGTPLSITANGLQTSFSDLLALLVQKWEEARKAHGTGTEKTG